MNLTMLCEELQGNCGDFFNACKECQLSPAFVSQWMKDDKEVSEKIENAKSVGALRLESAAIHRAVNGVDKGIYYQGLLVDTEKQYSDGLLTQLLKARVPGYKEESTQNVNVNLAAQIRIMPRATSYEEWLSFTQLKTVEASATPVPMLPAPHLDPAMADIL